MASVLLLLQLQLFSRKLLSATDTTLLVMKVAERNIHADILSICGVHFATLTQVRRNLTRGMLGTLSVKESVVIGKSGHRHQDLSIAILGRIQSW